MIEEFMSAARDGGIAALDLHAELVNVRHDGATALHFAAINGRLDAVRWLLEHGAPLDAQDDEFGMTPVAWANEKGQRAMVDFLLAQGASIQPFEAAAFGKLDRLQAFVAADPSVIAQEHQWGTVAHTACIWGQIEILEWLISQGASLTQKSPQGLTPLQIAQNQAKDGRSHTPIVMDERKAGIERDCARIVVRLREAMSAS
jgi:ankyrin repeat protein